MSEQRRQEPHLFSPCHETSEICSYCDGGRYAAGHRQHVITCLERHETPYVGWHLDWPDLYDEYFNRLSPELQLVVRELNAMNSQDFTFYRRAHEGRIP